jgi:hypothetical protein
MSSKKRTPKTLTKRERKALEGRGPSGSPKHQAQHIHCVACGAHLDESQFTSTPPTARYVRCQHGSRFSCCAGCVQEAMRRLDDHDRNNRPVQIAEPWH